MIQHSENFFPAECGELLALLVKYYKDNPAVKGDKEFKGVTAQNIYTFYKEMMEDIVSESGKAMKYYALEDFNLQITKELLRGLAQNIIIEIPSQNSD